MTTQIQPVRGEEFPRTFSKHVDDFGDWARIEPLFEELARRGGDLDSRQALEQWLLDQSELGAALDEEYSLRQCRVAPGPGEHAGRRPVA